MILDNTQEQQLLQEEQCTDHDMEFYEFEDEDGYFHGYECHSCGALQSG